MIPDNVFIRCHSFWRNDLLKPHFKALPGVILLGAMRFGMAHPVFSSTEDPSVYYLRKMKIS